MRPFEDFFTEENIINYLCRVRAKVAKQRNKKHLIHLLTANEKHNYHRVNIGKASSYQQQLQGELDRLFPPRKKWKNIGERVRFKGGNKQKINSTDRNVYSLQRTIKYYRQKEPNVNFLVELDIFIKDIQQSVKSSTYSIASPDIYPKPKVVKRKEELAKDEKNVCRPIALFSLKDRVILSFTNKFLTQLFDPFFDDCSLAFRVTKSADGSNMAHHEAVRRIIKFKEGNQDNALWVAECDMKKFYDSVDHKIILKQFEVLIEKSKKENPDIEITRAREIFINYLDIYSFNANVLPLNLDKGYWNKYKKIPQGEFGWIEKEIRELQYYKDINSERIGIPQGGALSGLIANIVLDYADKKVTTNEIFYVRFCDDMILMHCEKSKCEEGIWNYKDALKDLRLIPHTFSQGEGLKSLRARGAKRLAQMSLAPFWKGKSKGPYKWGDVKEEGFPWIGFVGYEMHFGGHIRVRKSSLEKEKAKQAEVVRQISKAIQNQKRVSHGTVTESAIHRLVGMSVGRVSIWNFNGIENDMCWKSGFKELQENKYSTKQLKALDRSRSKLYYKLVKDVYKMGEVHPLKKKENRQKIGYNKPFSYYYQVAERGRQLTNSPSSIPTAP